MSLPIVGAKGPNREPTHPALDFDRMLSLAGEVAEALEGLGATALTPALAEEIADELGVRASHLYAAVANMSAIPCEASEALRVEICVGSCQKWGALELLDRVLDVHAKRRFDGGPSFGVSAKRCLDRCAEGAVLLIHTPDGTAGLAPASLADLDQALGEALAVALPEPP